MADIAKQTGVDFEPLERQLNDGTHELKRLRTGMYQRYRGGNIDEGWTRLVLEQFAFPYTTLHGRGDQEGRTEREIRRYHPAGRFDLHADRRQGG